MSKEPSTDSSQENLADSKYDNVFAKISEANKNKIAIT